MLADRLEYAIAQAQRTQQILVVCYFDLDGFKRVNDQFGHGVGDQLLIEITTRIQDILRATDTLARLGGDEFALLLGTFRQEAECYPVLDRILATTEAPFVTHKGTLSVSASIGVTFYPLDEADASSLLRHADQALHQAKESGKNCFCIYDSEHHKAVQRTRKRRQQLTAALQHQEFVLYYQTKVHLVNGDIAGVEALIRWQHPDNGILPPSEFLPLILGSDLEIPLGEWVIATALQQMARWQADGCSLRVSVNISAIHLQQANFAERLQTLLAQQPTVSAHHLELEILESSALEDLQRVSQILLDCKQLGVHISLDDFGTGYSSLSYFRALPVETLKIDQSFVREMLVNADDLSIVESVIYLAHAMKRAVIAEGVESSAHARMLVELGCFYGQGYAIARPMPAADVLTWVTRWQEGPGLA